MKFETRGFAKNFICEYGLPLSGYPISDAVLWQQFGIVLDITQVLFNYLNLEKQTSIQYTECLLNIFKSKTIALHNLLVQFMLMIDMAQCKLDSDEICLVRQTNWQWKLVRLQIKRHPRKNPRRNLSTDKGIGLWGFEYRNLAKM